MVEKEPRGDLDSTAAGAGCAPYSPVLPTSFLPSHPWTHCVTVYLHGECVDRKYIFTSSIQSDLADGSPATGADGWTDGAHARNLRAAFLFVECRLPFGEIAPRNTRDYIMSRIVFFLEMNQSAR